MVKTGARVALLRQILGALGRSETNMKPPAPRLGSLPLVTADAVMALYRTLGGIQNRPRLAPGSWELAYDDGLVIELDEELHFHRYRNVTLDAQWAERLPWTDAYRRYVAEGERRAGTAGRRWTSPSAERMFGPADPDGVFSDNGAPRWKQRALYDAMKDAASAFGHVRLARLSIYDNVDGVALNEVLYRRAHVPAQAIGELVDRRSV